MKIWKIAGDVQKSIVQIARDILRYYNYDVKAMCLSISKSLRDELIKNGYGKAMVVAGEFYVDSPDESLWEDNLSNIEEGEEPNHMVLHYWVELNGKIIDITASQFNDELDNEKMPKIVIGTYDELSRYNFVNYYVE